MHVVSKLKESLSSKEMRSRRQKRTGERACEEHPAWHRGHESAREPRRGLVFQRHAKARPLPLRLILRICSLGGADAPIALQKQPRPNRIRPAGDQREPAVEAMQAVLLD